MTPVQISEREREAKGTAGLRATALSKESHFFQPRSRSGHWRWPHFGHKQSHPKATGCRWRPHQPPLSGVAKLPLPALGLPRRAPEQWHRWACLGEGRLPAPSPRCSQPRAERQRTQRRGCRKGPCLALSHTCPPQSQGAERRLAHLPQRGAPCLPCQAPRTGRGIPAGALGLDGG